VSRNDDDPAPPELVLDLDEAFRVLEALEDALSAYRQQVLFRGSKTNWRPSSDFFR
jgi:hypothetical protein